MADNHIDIGEPELTAEDAVKQRLLGRIAVAGVIIVGLLGSLAMFDALYAPRPQPPAPVATVAPPPAETPPAQPNEAPPAATPPVAEVPPVAATPEKTAAAPAEPLAPLPAERLTKPATGQKAIAQPSPVVTVPEAAKPPVAAAAPVAKAPPPPSRPLSQAAAQQPVAKPAGPLTALLPPDQPPRHFALQLGIFSNFANAEELRGKLEAAGIPTTVEARVRAGPFATRGEADAARVKLRQLGIEESIMVSVKR